jgi:DNA-binding response OmpR family regulator
MTTATITTAAIAATAAKIKPQQSGKAPPHLAGPSSLYAVLIREAAMSELRELSSHCQSALIRRSARARWVHDSGMSQTAIDSQQETSESSASLTILVVEDDPRMQKVLQRVFLPEGLSVVIASDGREAMTRFAQLRPSAVVLDLTLPHISGREVCKEMKRIAPDVPVLIVSAITEVFDKVLLFELGADDYITKPFSPRELLARVSAAIRRHQRKSKPADEAQEYRFGYCVIHFGSMTLERNGAPVVLTSLEFKLLKFFTQHAELMLSRELLLNEVWGYHSYPSTRTVDNQILKLRQKLEVDPSNPRHLLTLYGSGYKFVP